MVLKSSNVLRDHVKSFFGPGAFFRKPLRVEVLEKAIQWGNLVFPLCGLKVKTTLSESS